MRGNVFGSTAAAVARLGPIFSQRYFHRGGWYLGSPSNQGMTPDAPPHAAYRLPQPSASPAKASPYKLPQQHTVGTASPTKSTKASPYKLPQHMVPVSASSPARGSPYKLPQVTVSSSPAPPSLGNSQQQQLSDDSSTTTASSSQHGSEASSNASVAEAYHSADAATMPLGHTANSPDRQSRPVDAAGAADALRKRQKVVVTDAYRSRVAPTERTISEGGLGVIVKTYELGEGHIADVIWDCGKVLHGYCCGYRGLFDLEYAPACTPNKDRQPSLGAGRKLDYSPQPEPQHKIARSDSIEGDIKVHIGYMGNAPKVNYQKPKAIWSGDGPINYGDPSS